MIKNIHRRGLLKQVEAPRRSSLSDLIRISAHASTSAQDECGESKHSWTWHVVPTLPLTNYNMCNAPQEYPWEHLRESSTSSGWDASRWPVLHEHLIARWNSWWKQTPKEQHPKRAARSAYPTTQMRRVRYCESQYFWAEKPSTSAILTGH